MKTVPAPFLADLQSEVVALAACLRVELTNGTILGFTTSDKDLYIDSEWYYAATGVSAGDVVNNATLEVDNLELQGIMVSPAITEADLRAGLWDYAKMTLFLVNAEAVDNGTMVQRAGWIGEVTVEGGRFRAEFRGLTQAYTTSIIQLTSPDCRATFGDARCTKDLVALTVTGTVGTIDSDNVTIHDAARTESPHTNGVAYFIGGKLTFTSGLNNGLAMEIREATTGVLQLALPMPRQVANGDTYSLTPGCDRSLSTCKDYANVVNFRGEPHLRGNDVMVQQGRHT